MEGLVDLAVIDAFLAFHHGKESPVVAILAMYDTFDRGCEKSSARIVCCALALYVWLVSHLFLQEGRPVYPLQGHRSCVEKGKANWDQLLASMEGRLLIGSLARRKEESGFYLHAKDVQMFS